MEWEWVLWLVSGALTALVVWYRSSRSAGAVVGALLLGAFVGAVVVGIAQYSLVAVVVGALFLDVWLMLFALVHWLRARRGPTQDRRHGGDLRNAIRRRRATSDRGNSGHASGEWHSERVRSWRTIGYTAVTSIRLY